MKVGRMKAFIRALCILLVAGLILQQAAASGIVTLGSSGMISGVAVQRMEEKMAQALQGLGLKQIVPAAQPTVSASEPQPETPTNYSDELNISATELINETELNLTVNETALEFESKGVVVNENELIPAISTESLESDILAEVATTNTPEPAESAEQPVSESSTKDLAQLDMKDGESAILNVSANNLTTVETNLTTVDANATTMGDNMTIINMSSETLLPFNANATTMGDNMTIINMSSETLLPFNASAANLTINATELNSTELNSTDMNLSNSKSTNVPCKSCSNKAEQNIGGGTSAAVNGFWGMQSNQHTIGGTDIKSNTFLSGDFEVDKNVQFQDRDY
jgi:hypothetical protein